MDTLKANSNPSNERKEKHPPRDQHPTNTRTMSYEGDPRTKRGHAGYDETGTREIPERNKPSENFPSLTLNGQQEEEEEEEAPPPPPPEITNASVLATARLKNSMSELRDTIVMYEQFDAICHDTPSWPFFVAQQVSNIRSSLRSTRHVAGYIAYLREGGQGTVERGGLERLAREVILIEKEARKEWSRIGEGFKEGQEEEEGKEKTEEEQARCFKVQMRAYRDFIGETYVRTMKVRLGQLEAVAGEVEMLKGELTAMWEEVCLCSEEELDELEERY